MMSMLTVLLVLVVLMVVRTDEREEAAGLQETLSDIVERYGPSTSS